MMASIATFPADLHVDVKKQVGESVPRDKFVSRADAFVFVVNDNEWNTLLHVFKPNRNTVVETLTNMNGLKADGCIGWKSKFRRTLW